MRQTIGIIGMVIILVVSALFIGRPLPLGTTVKAGTSTVQTDNLSVLARQISTNKSVIINKRSYIVEKVGPSRMVCLPEGCLLSRKGQSGYLFRPGSAARKEILNLIGAKQ